MRYASGLSTKRRHSVWLESDTSITSCLMSLLVQSLFTFAATDTVQGDWRPRSSIIGMLVVDLKGSLKSVDSALDAEEFFSVLANKSVLLNFLCNTYVESNWAAGTIHWFNSSVPGRRLPGRNKECAHHKRDSGKCSWATLCPKKTSPTFPTVTWKQIIRF